MSTMAAPRAQPLHWGQGEAAGLPPSGFVVARLPATLLASSFGSVLDLLHATQRLQPAQELPLPYCTCKLRGLKCPLSAGCGLLRRSGAAHACAALVRWFDQVRLEQLPLQYEKIGADGGCIVRWAGAP